METKEKYDLIIVGSGLSGLLLANKLCKTHKILIISKGEINNSKISGGEICTRGLQQKSLFSSIFISGDSMSDLNLLKIFLDNLEKNITDFSLEYGIKASFLGGNINIGIVLQSIRKILIDSKNVDFLDSEVFKICKNRYSYLGVIIKDKEEFIFKSSKALAITSGGFGNIFGFNDNIDNDYLSNMAGICIESGIRMRNLEFLMFHPFGEKLNGLNNLSGKIVKTDFLAGKEVKNKDGKNIPDLEYILNSHNAHQSFSEILKVFEKNKELTIDNKRYDPIVHYTIGGIDVNKDLETNIKGIYTVGEASIGVSGASRIGGIALSEIIVFSEIISKKIDDFLITKKEILFDYKDEFNIDLVKVRNTKKEVQKMLTYDLLYGGNVYEYKIILGKIEKLYDCSYKIIAIALLKSMIMRKESRGSFYRQDFRNKSFFTYNTVLIYKNGKINTKRKYINNLIRFKYYIYKKFFHF
nr:FAD-binding protein [Candidatus Gracilibacteria bacterium]